MRKIFSAGKVKTMGGLDSYNERVQGNDGPVPPASPDSNLPSPSWRARKKKGINKEPAQWVSGTQISV